MADALVILVYVVGVVLAVPVLVLFVEIVASLFHKDGSASATDARPRLAVIVPAHDEALTIRATLAALRREIADGDRIVVVADNCTDNTAELARSGGAEVIVRTDTSRRGKGFALDFGLSHLASDSPEVVVIIDADCEPQPGCLSTIAALAVATQRPVQSRYEMMPPVGVRSPYLSVAALAIRVKNLARPLGYRQLGLGCQLMGTGMAFPWSVISKANLATSEIVEDLVYGLELASEGHAPLFCPHAVVTSRFPIASEGQTTQRARWESGHLNTIVTRLPRLMLDATHRANYLLLALVLDAAVPPLAFLALLIAAFSGMAALTWVFTGNTGPIIAAVALGFLFAVTVVIAWRRFATDILSMREAALVPGYILSKLGLYARVFAGRKIGWIRSKRDA